MCLTDKRLSRIEYGPMGKILFQDAFIEDVNSGIIYQPSVFWLYFVGILLACTFFGLLLIPGWVRLYYQVNKSGMVWSIREGFSVYAFLSAGRVA